MWPTIDWITLMVSVVLEADYAFGKSATAEPVPAPAAKSASGTTVPPKPKAHRQREKVTYSLKACKDI